MKRIAIPILPATSQLEDSFNTAVKASLDNLTGQLKSSEQLSQLSTSASTAEIVNQINIIIRRLNGT